MDKEIHENVVWLSRQSLGIEIRGKLINMKRFLKNTCGTLYEYIDDVVELDNAFIIRFKGDVDAQTIPCIRFNLEKTEDEYVCKNIIVDFKNVKHIDTATFAVILEFLGQLKANDNHLFLINVNARLGPIWIPGALMLKNEHWP